VATTIQATGLIDAEGNPANGAAIIEWEAFTSGGLRQPAGNRNVQVHAGSFDTTLEPGTYTVAWMLDHTTTWSETWTVPASATPLTPDQVIIAELPPLNG
jgi:hypothetical protein